MMIDQIEMQPCIMRSGRTINWDRPVNVEAVLIQITGSGVYPECSHCAKKLGPFEGCITAAGIANGSCGNCHYNSEGTRCDLHKATPAKKRGRDRNVLEEPEEPQQAETSTRPSRRRKDAQPEENAQPVKRQKKKKSRNADTMGSPAAAIQPQHNVFSAVDSDLEPYSFPEIMGHNRAQQPYHSFAHNPFAQPAAHMAGPGFGGMGRRSSPAHVAFAATPSPGPARGSVSTPATTATYAPAPAPATPAHTGGNSINITVPGNMGVAEARRMARMLRNIADAVEAMADPELQ